MGRNLKQKWVELRKRSFILARDLMVAMVVETEKPVKRKKGVGINFTKSKDSSWHLSKS